MSRPSIQGPKRGDARTRLLDAALAAIRQNGFTATSIEDLCERAGVSKGAYFHHFKSKEDIGVAAARYWTEVTAKIFEAAPYHDTETASGRVLAYVAFRKAMIKGNLAEFTCLVGTMAQETFDRHAAIRDACGASIMDHATTLEADIAHAMNDACVSADWTALSLATHIQTVIQGAFVVAKATNDSSVALDSLDHLSRYLECLFQRPTPEEKSDAKRS